MNRVIGQTIDVNNPIPQYEILKSTAQKHPENIAINYFGRKITYKDLLFFTDNVSSQLKIEKGDIIILSMQNIPQFVILEYAIWKKGGIILPVNPSYSERELEYLISDSNPKFMIASCESIVSNKVPVIRTNPETFSKIPSELKDKWKILDCKEEIDFSRSKDKIKEEKVSSEDLALLMYTSGTTGKPKGVPITHKNIFASSIIYNKWFKFSEGDKVLGIAPFFHVTGQIFHITTAIYSGSEINATFRFEPKLALKVVEENKTTVTMSVATAYRAMLNVYNNEDLSSMRLWSSGGMPMPKALELEWKEKIGPWIYMAWGLTETTSPATLWPYPYDGKLPVDPETGIVSSGIPVYSTEILLGDDGEVFVKGPQVVSGYWKMDKFKDGWLPTGDLGKIIDGWIYIIDRKKEIIDASGFKIMPREVEEVLYMYPAVDEAVVVGLPDEYRGETVVAYVKLKDGYYNTEEIKKDIITFCRKYLAPYKVPKEIRFVNEIPKTPSGKIMRRAFRNDS
ncbi:AMP-binding protein [Acidianus manzaensis]|uniref:AMP-dependent synthetase n=1 Tax=Acidianus manzaensis TaxID=282676 RepID=A0A1W6JZA3_9CREN|nr:AMP-binding protein [Acidianus manzaensis]ARM75540.1 AMP-dependent synthetase [Acidianus manzaensis]